MHPSTTIMPFADNTFDNDPNKRKHGVFSSSCNVNASNCNFNTSLITSFASTRPNYFATDHANAHIPNPNHGGRDMSDSTIQIHSSEIADSISAILKPVDLISHYAPRWIDGTQQHISDYWSNIAFVTLKPADRSPHSVPRCMDGTRQYIFDEINRWLYDFQDEPNILLFIGSPGSGKSTIASSMVSTLDDCDRLGSHFFFTRGHAELGNPAFLWRTVAYDLARRNPTFAMIVADAVNNSKVDPGRSNLYLDFKYLIQEPLMETYSPWAPSYTFPVIIIDALDECDFDDSQVRQRKALLDTLALWSQLPKRFKLIITSRDNRLPDTFCDKCKQIVLRTGSDVGEEENDDIRLFFEESFPDGTPLSVPRRQEIILQLTMLSAGLFIWAKIAIEVLKLGFTDEKLNRILRGSPRDEEKVPEIYWQLLDSIFPEGIDGHTREVYEVVLSGIIFTKVPLHYEDLHLLLSIPPNSVQPMLDTLSPVISSGQDNRLRIIHPSFIEFLCDSKCPKQFRINRRKEIQRLARACLKRMKEGLEFNICGLETSYLRNDQVEDLSNRIQMKVPGSLLYSCRYWATHLPDIVEYGPLLEVKEFLYHRLLFWLEIMSLINDISAANVALLTAAPWIEKRDTDLSAFVSDASQFIINFDRPISTSAPHIYISALPFCPSESMVAKQYRPLFPNTLSVISGRDVDWPALVNLFRGHTGAVCSIAFSPDGRKIISGSDDKTVKIWDTETGQLLAGSFEDHDFSVSSIAFSPDGRVVTSGSEDGMIRVWNTNAGTGSSDDDARPASRRFPKHHKGAITSLAFSRDGTKIISGSDDKTAFVWDVETGQVIAGPFESTGSVISVAFSPDDKRVVLSTSDWPIQIRDAETGSIIPSSFGGHTHKPISIALSDDGAHIVSGSSNGTILIWAVKTGQVAAGPFRGHEGAVYAVAFSPDGKHVVSGSKDKTIRIWNLKMNQTNVAVSNSVDKTVPVWSSEIAGDSSPQMKEHLNRIPSISGRRTLPPFCGKRVGGDGWLRQCDPDPDPSDPDEVHNKLDHDPLLFYVPPSHRDGLCGIETKVVFGAQPTRVDLSRFEYGESWTKCRLIPDCSVPNPDPAKTWRAHSLWRASHP